MVGAIQLGLILRVSIPQGLSLIPRRPRRAQTSQGLSLIPQQTSQGLSLIPQGLSLADLSVPRRPVLGGTDNGNCWEGHAGRDNMLGGTTCWEGQAPGIACWEGQAPGIAGIGNSESCVLGGTGPGNWAPGIGPRELAPGIAGPGNFGNWEF